jgi:phosphopantothenoylcysteine decarboxylase/phosphopantothenate--cysteine ligase
MLEGRSVVLGVTGSIAAYKAVEIASQLTQAGAAVDVIMTKSALEFIAPLSFQALTHRPVVFDLFELQSEMSVQHVGLAERANIVTVAPATANVIAKMANGIADDSLTCTVLATRAPVLVVPAMNYNMYENTVTQENIEKLRRRGFTIMEPSYGRLASGAVGRGRLPEICDIIGTIRQVLGRTGDLAGRRLVVTAGGTQEPIDPARLVTNRSTGKMGYAIAEAARDRGASVTLIAAPTALPDPVCVRTVHVQTAVQMRDAVLAAIQGSDALIMTAAVADFRPAQVQTQKVKKTEARLTLELEKNPDILAEVGEIMAGRPEKGPKVVVGFAAESDDIITNAVDKLRRKNLDMIVANDITASDSGFAVDTNRVTLIKRSGEIESLPLLLKSQVAERVLSEVSSMLQEESRASAR